jgi:hypothetical protein
LAFGAFNLVTGMVFEVAHYAVISVFWFLDLLKKCVVKSGYAMAQELLCILFNLKALCLYNRRYAYAFNINYIYGVVFTGRESFIILDYFSYIK